MKGDRKIVVMGEGLFLCGGVLVVRFGVFRRVFFFGRSEYVGRFGMGRASR